MRPVVGVMPLWDGDRDSIWMLPGYMNGLEEAGAVPFIFPFTDDREELEQLASLCDGFLLTGGDDVQPSLYGEKPLEGLVECCRKRDELESIVLSWALENDRPVLGICRGIQFINTYLGGSLYQDLPFQHPSKVEHHQKAPYDIPCHEVRIVRDSPLYSCLGRERIPVNSYHHQAVRRIADDLEVMALSPDGLVEALYMPSHRFLWAVQWHPEFSYLRDENSRMIFRSFVSSMEG